MHNFCTLFDSSYLTRGLVMYRSLEATGEDFTLYIVCFDDMAYEIINRLNLSRAVAISLSEFESPQLLAIKDGRTAGEYCWTCTPHIIRYALDTYQLTEVTYLDADLCFYERPSILLDEFRQSGSSVLITSHRYTPRHDQSKKSGIYCVQFMTFKADGNGIKVLQWWQDRCLEWCYNRFEDGKFGDQKYLDDWPERFTGIHALEHLGGGVAPWNVQQYSLNQSGAQFRVDDWPLVFYHFHGYKHYLDDTHDFGNYQLDISVVELLYRPYVQSLEKAYAEVDLVWLGFDRGRVRRQSWKVLLRKIRRKLKG